MTKRKFALVALMPLAVTTAGCSMLPQYPPSEEGIQKYGRHCEQLGNFKGTPDFDKCIKKMEEIYR